MGVLCPDASVVGPPPVSATCITLLVPSMNPVERGRIDGDGRGILTGSERRRNTARDGHALERRSACPVDTGGVHRDRSTGAARAQNRVAQSHVADVAGSTCHAAAAAVVRVGSFVHARGSAGGLSAGTRTDAALAHDARDPGRSAGDATTAAIVVVRLLVNARAATRYRRLGMHMFRSDRSRPRWRMSLPFPTARLVRRSEPRSRPSTAPLPERRRLCSRPRRTLDSAWCRKDRRFATRRPRRTAAAVGHCTERRPPYKSHLVRRRGLRHCRRRRSVEPRTPRPTRCQSRFPRRRPGRLDRAVWR